MNKHTIKVGIIGCVSTGKSTLINAFFLEQFSDMKIQRTTMLPQVYTETLDEGLLKNAKQINKETTTSNEALIKETEQNHALAIENCTELQFFVSKISHFNILEEGVMFSIYDIPGLNDSRTKNTYYEYLRNNFHKFDVIMFVIDINSALNTSDEIDILTFIADNLKKFKQIKKNIYVIPIANKCDNMEIEGTHLKINEEHSDMYSQIKNHIEQIATKLDIEELFSDVVPLCASDAFLFRMLEKNKDFALSAEQMKRIGHDNMGYKFNKLDHAKQREKLNEIFGDQEFINNMVEKSGFFGIESALKNLLTKQRQIEMLGNSIIHRAKEITVPSIAELFAHVTKFDEIIRVTYSIDKMEKEYKFTPIIKDILIGNLRECLQNCKYTFDSSEGSVNIYTLKTIIGQIESHKFSKVCSFRADIKTVCAEYLTYIGNEIYEHHLNKITTIQNIYELHKNLLLLNEQNINTKKLDDFIKTHIRFIMDDSSLCSRFYAYANDIGDFETTEKAYITVLSDIYAIDTTLSVFVELTAMIICMKYWTMFGNFDQHAQNIYKSLMFLNERKYDDVIFNKLHAYYLLTVSKSFEAKHNNIFNFEYKTKDVALENYLAEVIEQNKSDAVSNGSKNSS